MKILILALSGIGDALMFTPAIKLMRSHLPDAQIDALVMFKGVKDMYDRNPHLNNVYHFDFLKEGSAASLLYMLKLRGRYDASINVYPSNRKEYNVINFLTGAKKRAGVKYLRKDKENFGPLNNVRVTEDDFQHNVVTNIKLVEKLLDTKLDVEPLLEFYLTEEDQIFAEKYLSDLSISSDDLVIGFHPGSATFKNHEKRRWEPEKFASLASKLIEEKTAKILIFGGPEEKDLRSKIKDQTNSINIFSVETKNLAQTAAVMKRCNVFVSNDSSLMHVAAALRLKIAAIIGPTNPAYIHPWKTQHKIVSLYLECSPCFIYSPRPLICFRDDVKFKCIKELGVDMVYNSVNELLAT